MRLRTATLRAPILIVLASTLPACSSKTTAPPTDNAPTVSAPATALVLETQALTVNVTATDPDGQAISMLSASGVPAGAAFTPGAGNTSGTLNWTPGLGVAGTYTVTFTAANALSGSANTVITVSNGDNAPVVTAPVTVSVVENQALTVNVTAADPDGQALISLTASGVPAGATFTAGPGNTSGTLNWTPAPGVAGNYTVTFTASNALSGSANTQITVTPVQELSSGTIGPGGMYQHTFASAGTYPYHCAIHGLSMAGTVVVANGQPANAAVSIQNNNTYSPATVSVAPGGTVTWTNNGSNHTVTSN